MRYQMNKLPRITMNMKYAQRLALLLLFCSFIIAGCVKPSYKVGLNFNQEIMKYGVTFQFCNAGDTTRLPQYEVFVKITGRDASKIYDYNGTKSFGVLRGIMNIGLDPNVTPTVANPIQFVLEAYGPDYLPVRIPVTIDGSFKQQRVLVTLINVKDPPNGISVGKNTFGVDATGALINTEIFISPITTSTPENVKITIPAGTQFLDAGGNVIAPNGSDLTVQTVFFSTRTAYSMSAFPTGSVYADSIVTPTGKIAGFHQSTGMAYVEMNLGGKDVKATTQPMTYEIVMDQNYISAGTNNPITAGEVIPIWNYDFTKNKWDFVQNTTTQFSGGTLKSTFTTTLLKYLSVGWVTPLCTQSTSLTFNNGLNIPTTYLIDILSQNGDRRHPLVTGLYLEVVNGQVVNNLPIPSGPVEIRVYENNLFNSQYNYFIRGNAPLAVYSGIACGTNINLNTTNPIDLQSHYFGVIGYCPNANYYIYPSIPTLYKRAHVKTNYSLLGSVRVGILTTTNLRINNEYHFAWIAGDKLFTKEKLIDSSTYTRVIPVPATVPGDTLREMWCY